VLLGNAQVFGGSATHEPHDILAEMSGVLTHAIMGKKAGVNNPEVARRDGQVKAVMRRAACYPVPL
jgi:hypothetical protein